MQTSTVTQHDVSEDEAYQELVSRLRTAVKSEQGPLFTTDAMGLYDAFLSAIPAHRRQHYECRACRKFFDTFGSLVKVDDKGRTGSILYAAFVPGFFRSSIAAAIDIVDTARVTGVFLSSASVWGLPENDSPKSPTGRWTHMHVMVPSSARFNPGPLKTCEQVMAEKREDFGTLCRGLGEYGIDTVRKAHGLLTTGGLYRSEKCIGVAKWLLDLHEAREATKNKQLRETLTWRAVATAPVGFCHVRSTMIGTLLEDVESGKPFDAIKRAFDSKMNPLGYQRPQAAPTDGQLAAAEKVVEKLASAGAFERRFATIEDIADDAVWMPKAPKFEAPNGEVFGHLKSNKRPASMIDVPAQTMTWDKFWRTVLPEAEQIECQVPQHGSFFAFVTATHPEAPPILQWDRDGARNPVSWYLYASGSDARQWNLQGGSWVSVTAITTQPSSWGGGSDHQGNGAYFVLEGAKDTTSSRAGLGLFPEILKSDYHGIRSAMEAYSRSKRLSGEERASACGLAMQKSAGPWQCTVRVTSRGTRVVYKIDRWD